MPILLKSPADIERMRAASAVVADVHARLEPLIRPGVTTRELDQVAHELITSAGGHPSFLGYHGYPASICASINDVVLHGIPGDVELREGDIISIDLGVKLDGFHGDAAVTYPVGRVSDIARRLIEAAEACFWAGFAQLRAGGRLGDASAAVQATAEAAGFAVIREYVGHGIGRQMHEDPPVPNFGLPGDGPRLRRGMTLALEPMICAGAPETRILDDGWTVVMADGALAAHFEHTIAILGDTVVSLTAARERVI
ncbi:MAG TPA: type I methionyl aminopeptidase [Thermomicrobiales bacterium]|nr:type I methionyl aminopeptidase [Thermomicrobiales bacterium]